VTATFQDRLDIALTHEDVVRQRLESSGWAVSPHGQGIMAENIRRAIQRTDSGLRWLPDFIAARDGQVVLIDAKTRITSTATGRHAVSCRALRAHNLLTAWADLPVYYVFECGGVQTPHDVLCATRCGPHLSLQHLGAYALTPCGLDRPFADVFG
jgi:hypothetical protein